MSHGKTPRPFRAMAPDTEFAGARFEAGTMGRERLTTWEPHPVLRARKVAGASTIKRQHLRYEPDTLNLRILLDSGEAYLALLDVLGTTGTLRIPELMVVVTPSDTVWHNFGVDYVIYDDVTLVDITKIEQTREWWVMAQVTFEREHPEGGA